MSGYNKKQFYTVYFLWTTTKLITRELWNSFVKESYYLVRMVLCTNVGAYLNAAVEGEMDAHLTSEERSQGNRRNGKMPEQVQTLYGEVTVETPRDRDGSFEPQTVKKRETILAEGMADQIIDMLSQQLAIKFGERFEIM